MIDFKEVPATSILATQPVAADYSQFKPLAEALFSKKDINSGAILTYPLTTVGDFMDVFFLLLKEITIQSADTNNELFQAQTILKSIYKENNNLDKLLTMLLGTIIKRYEHKTNNTSTN